MENIMTKFEQRLNETFGLWPFQKPSANGLINGLPPNQIDMIKTSYKHKGIDTFAAIRFLKQKGIDPNEARKMVDQWDAEIARENRLKH
jgi:hypothetical protein